MNLHRGTEYQSARCAKGIGVGVEGSLQLVLPIRALLPPCPVHDAPFRVVFAMIYKIMPRVRIDWKDVWIGAAAISLLFTVGKFLIGVYIRRSGNTQTLA